MSHPVKLKARIGIATGLVVVGDLIGEGSAQEQSVVGETPNLAARLQTLAEPNAVVIAAGTRRLIGHLFEIRDLGAVAVKGIAAPVAGLAGIASKHCRKSVRGVTWLGADPADRSRRGNRPVVAPLGARKSRRWPGRAGLGRARYRQVASHRCIRGAIARLATPRLRYFCSPYHQDSALYPFIDQLGRAAGFGRDDPPAARLEKLEALISFAAPPKEDMALLADLMSLPPTERHALSDLSPQRKKGERWRR